MSLNKYSNFMQVLNSIITYSTKNGYFRKYIPFSTIYLLQEHKLNHRNYSKQKNKYEQFCKSYTPCCEHVCNVWRFYFLCIFVNKYSKV
jgi:hypothetical protein